ncbi:MAG TPA: DUF3037 domain-containing protein [Terracidiphilus sp.]|nr:DUF3037 domain-containing protein [Terracidiphilus sp.]
MSARRAAITRNRDDWKVTAAGAFHWMISPRSTIIQPSPVHTGVCDGMDGLLVRLAKQFLYV